MTKNRDALEAVLKLHSPQYAPEGNNYMGHEKGVPLCDGCATGDPYLDREWPCGTIEVIYKYVPDMVEEFYTLE